MTDKTGHRRGCSSSEPMHHACWIEDGTVMRRRIPSCDELRAENERLKRLEVWFTEAIDALHTDVEHLKSELGEVTDLYTTYRGMVHDGVQVADVIKTIRGQMAALRISERAWMDQNERLRAELRTCQETLTACLETT